MVQFFGAGPKHYLEYVREMLMDDKTQPQRSFYISCFCEDPDSLSLWRGYCPPFAGYSFGYDWNVDQSSELMISKCIYKDNEKEAITKEHLDECFSIGPCAGRLWFRKQGLELESPIVNDIQVLAAYFVIHMNIVVCSFKHSAFEDEREWRIVSFTSPKKPGLNFRVGQKGMIPYRSISLVRNNVIPIEEIRVGPTDDIEKIQESLREYVENLAVIKGRVLVRCKNVAKSRIPFRMM